MQCLVAIFLCMLGKLIYSATLFAIPSIARFLVSPVTGQVLLSPVTGEPLVFNG